MKPKMLLVVRGDHNDADWITKVTPISEKAFNRFMPLFEAIKNFKSYKGKSSSGIDFNHSSNWPVGEYGHRGDLGEKSIAELYGELADEFDEEYVPHADGNIHTIHEIYVVNYDKHFVTSKRWPSF